MRGVAVADSPLLQQTRDQSVLSDATFSPHRARISARSFSPLLPSFRPRGASHSVWLVGAAPSAMASASQCRADPSSSGRFAC